jgi:hypothetical protein
LKPKGQGVVGNNRSANGGRARKSHYPCFSLPWAIWLIARLGGWSGYRSQRPPGMPTLIHGLRQFESILLGWKLAQTLLVGTQ